MKNRDTKDASHMTTLHLFAFIKNVFVWLKNVYVRLNLTHSIMEKIQCLKENIINPDQTYQYDVDTLKGIPIVIDNGKVNYINYEFHI